MHYRTHTCRQAGKDMIKYLVNYSTIKCETTNKQIVK